MRTPHTIYLAVLVLGLFAAACDTVEPKEPGTLVVELYAQPDRPPPPLRLHRSAAFGLPQAGVRDAIATLTVGGRSVRYLSTSEPGIYEPEDPESILEAGSRFRLDVRTGRESVSIDGTVPPAVGGATISLDIPDRPVRTVLLDSLTLPIDSLQLAVPGETGYVYPVIATLTWDAPPAGDAWWMQTRLVPLQPFSSTLIEYFLRPEGLVRERAGPRIQWQGVYAVPVDGPDDPLPRHDLRAVVARGSYEWAAFAASDHDPDRREPAGNVPGGLGIVVGIAMDTLRVSVR